MKTFVVGGHVSWIQTGKGGYRRSQMQLYREAGSPCGEEASLAIR